MSLFTMFTLSHKKIQKSHPPSPIQFCAYFKEDVRSWSSSFQNVMRSEIGRQIFTKFLESEYSDENMLFWHACEDLKKEESYMRRKNMAKDIYEMFVGPSAPLEINLESRVKVELKRKIEKPDRTIFNAAQKSVYTLMERDCYQRFVKSKVYRDFLANIELPHRLM